MPATAGTTPAPVRNSVRRFRTSKSGGKTPASSSRSTFPGRVLVYAASVVSSGARAVNGGKGVFTPLPAAAKIAPTSTSNSGEEDQTMPISMYHASVPVFLQLLGGLKGVIEKAEATATAKKWEENTLLNWRLYPDMFTFARQVRQASEHAFGAGRAAGVAVPELPAIDNSLAEMKARIDKTIDFLKGLRADQLDGREDAQVTITQGGQPRNFRAQVYLYHLAMPNFYFHITTAYNILRSLGIDIGKRDFMGQMPS